MAVYWLSSEWIIKIKIKNNELVTQPNKQENQVAIFVAINQHVHFFFFFYRAKNKGIKLRFEILKKTKYILKNIFK